MRYDAIIIGGGPGGSAVASLLAKGKRRVLVLEKEHFPRFHIGESLLPYNSVIFDEMGVTPALEAANFPLKYGAQFHLGNASRSLSLTFRHGRYTKHFYSMQVERAKFDHILLKNAASCGAEVREGWTVIKHTNDEQGVSVTARDEQGKTETFEGSFLVDASGRGNFTGNQEKLRMMHPKLKKLSMFGQFEGVMLDEGDKKGDTVIFCLEDKWFWLIPLSPTKTSVGCVMDQKEFTKSKETPAEQFDRVWKSSSALRERMNNAQLVSPIQTTTDFSYHNQRLAGPRLLRVGDAAGFMDPIFSSGVFLAMYSGRLAARAIEQSLVAGDSGMKRFKHYEKTIVRAMHYYWTMVEAFYTRPFMEMFIQPRIKFRLTDAIVAILAGELEGGWKIEWRRKLFFALVKLHTWRRLVPPISYEENELERVKMSL